MHAVIKDILNSDQSVDKKKETLAEIKKSIELAERIFKGEFTYCEKCEDYYLTKSFFQESETVREKVCVYSDPINSGGDEYAMRGVTYFYKYCPKGCKHQICRTEH